MQKSLTDLRLKEQGEVIAFNGGRAMQQRLEQIGIRRGKIISRISTQPIRGPIIVAVDGHQTAVGRNMASRIMVNTDPQTSGSEPAGIEPDKSLQDA